jgi:hypothetical protein
LILWYNELASTLEAMGFVRNPYDVCSFRRIRDGSTDRILVYVDDLFITSKHEHVLTSIATTLKQKYGAVTSNMGLEHNFLGIHWGFRAPGQATLSSKKMERPRPMIPSTRLRRTEDGS